MMLGEELRAKRLALGMSVRLLSDISGIGERTIKYLEKRDDGLYSTVTALQRALAEYEKYLLNKKRQAPTRNKLILENEEYGLKRTIILEDGKPADTPLNKPFNFSKNENCYEVLFADDRYKYTVSINCNEDGVVIPEDLRPLSVWEAGTLVAQTFASARTE